MEKGILLRAVECLGWPSRSDSPARTKAPLALSARAELALWTTPNTQLPSEFPKTCAPLRSGCSVVEGGGCGW